MTLSEQIIADMKTAMKEKDKVSLTVLRALKTANTNAAIEKGGLGTELTDAEVSAIIRKQIKQRQDSITQFETAGRSELAETEAAEIVVLERYLPAALSDEEFQKILDETFAETGASSKADMGKVMGLLKERTDGRVDGKTLSQAVMARLS